MIQPGTAAAAAASHGRRQRPQRLGHRLVGQQPLELVAAALQDPHTLPALLIGELLHQPRLAHAGLTADQQQAALPGERRLPAVGQERQLLLPAHQRDPPRDIQGMPRRLPALRPAGRPARAATAVPGAHSKRPSTIAWRSARVSAIGSTPSSAWSVCWQRPYWARAAWRWPSRQ